MIVTNGQEGIDIISVVDARDDESLVRFLKSRSVRAGIACKNAAVVSNRLFEDFDGVTATAYTSKQHIHTFRALSQWVLPDGGKFVRKTGSHCLTTL
jgi:hypothetical protein